MDFEVLYAEDDIVLTSFWDKLYAQKDIKGKSLARLRKRSLKRYGRRDDAFRYFIKNRHNISVGKYSYGYEAVCMAKGSTISQIGSFCSFAENVGISPGEHPLDLISTSPAFYMAGFGLSPNDALDVTHHREKIIIGHDVWVGRDTTILSGVKIETGAVIAAGAVVTKNVPAYAIVGGVPAKIIRYRFDETTIERLLESKWWLWTDEQLRVKMPLFQTSDVSKLWL